jgi:hypothetical protein
MVTRSRVAMESTSAQHTPGHAISSALLARVTASKAPPGATDSAASARSRAQTGRTPSVGPARSHGRVATVDEAIVEEKTRSTTAAVVGCESCCFWETTSVTIRSAHRHVLHSCCSNLAPASAPSPSPRPRRGRTRRRTSADVRKRLVSIASRCEIFSVHLGLVELAKISNVFSALSITSH